MAFPLGPEVVTLNTVNCTMGVILRYFNKFGSFGGQFHQSVEIGPILSAAEM